MKNFHMNNRLSKSGSQKQTKQGGVQMRAQNRYGIREEPAMNEGYRAATSGNATPAIDAPRIQQSAFGDALSSGHVYQDAQALN